VRFNSKTKRFAIQSFADRETDNTERVIDYPYGNRIADYAIAEIKIFSSSLFLNLKRRKKTLFPPSLSSVSREWHHA